MTDWVNLAAVVPLAIGMILLKRAWALHGTGRTPFVPAICALGLSVALFCSGLGLALGLIVGLSMVGTAGIVASAASADLGRPRLLVRAASQATSGLSARRMLSGGWRLLLAGPVALCAGLGLGLVAFSIVPGADADRLVACTLATIVAAGAMIGWSCSDQRLTRATLVGLGVLAAFAAAAAMLGRSA